MYGFPKQKTGRYGALFMIAAFAMAGVFVVMSMPMSEGGHTVSCPFMNGTQAICTMSVLEHVAAWRSAFSSFAAENNPLALLAFLFITAVFLLFRRRRVPAMPPPASRRTFDSARTGKAVGRVLRVLQEAFSNGILHPKIF